MKNLLSTTKQSVILLILASAFYACKTLLPPEPSPLIGTKWKLDNIRIYREIIVLEPNDCDTCFTFTFDTDTTAVGMSILNTINISKSGGRIAITTTEYDEPYDGNLFREIMRKSTGITRGSWHPDAATYRTIILNTYDFPQKLLIFKQVYP